MKGLRGKLFAVLTAAVMMGPPSAQAQTYNLMPQPVDLAPGSGRLVIDGSFRVALEGYQEPRLVDAVPPESGTARIFAGRVDHWRENESAVRRQLLVWRDSREPLVPLMMKSALLHEDVPLAEDLSAVARAGLEALDYLDSGNPAPQAWVEEQFVLLDLAAKPRAELLLMIVEPVRKLVEAARGSG